MKKVDSINFVFENLSKRLVLEGRIAPLTCSGHPSHDVIVFYIQHDLENPRIGHCGQDLGGSLIVHYLDTKSPSCPSYLAT